VREIGNKAVSKTLRHTKGVIIMNMSNVGTFHRYKVEIDTLADVREFVNKVVMIEYEVDLQQGRYTIDAKSIMGIFSLDLMNPITVIAHTDYAGDFFESLEKFKV
jgi:hypothetical protein